MEVRMRVVGEVFWYHHLPETQVMVEPGTELGPLLVLLGVDVKETTVAINGQVASLASLLSDGDEILIQPKKG
jgi:hypothetical protein